MRGHLCAYKAPKLEPVETYGGAVAAFRCGLCLGTWRALTCDICGSVTPVFDGLAWRKKYCSPKCVKQARATRRKNLRRQQQKGDVQVRAR